MKNRLLFWIDDSHVHFGIAKYFSEKSTDEIYAIFDVNHITKNFYQNQTIVNFKKTWFWRDYQSPKPHIPDMDFLKKFEEKYGLNIWLLAYTEKKFFKFNEIKKFSLNEILSITEDECRIFEKILDEVKPDFILMGITDLHRNVLFNEICKSKNIPVLMLSPIRFGTKYMISSDWDVIDDFDPTKINWNELTFTQDENYLENNDPRKSQEKRFINRENKLGISGILLRHLKFIINICNDEYRQFYENWGKTRLQFLRSKEFILPYLIKRSKRERYLNKFAIKLPPLHEKFIYFPLHHEPERTLLLNAPFFTNQLEVIMQIAKSIPVDYKVYVKEHYSMRNEAWRDLDFYKKLLEMPNVVLIHPFANSKSLLQNCSLIITITGTSAMEAGFYKKPSIVFSQTSFSYLPFVKTITKFDDLPKVIKSQLTSNHDYSSINHYVELLDKNSFDVDPMEMMYDVAVEIHDFNGLTKEVNIPHERMINFLEKHKVQFEKIVSEHLKYLDRLKEINIKKTL